MEKKGGNILQKRMPEDISEKERKSKMADCSKTEVFDEHPRKTRQSEFLKMFPNAVLIARDWLQYHSDTKDDCPVIDICPHKVDTTLEVDCKDVRSCYVCRKEYWQAEME